MHGDKKYLDDILLHNLKRFINTFWNDSLTEADRLNQICHAEKCLAGLQKRQARLRNLSADPTLEQRAKELLAEIEYDPLEAEKKKRYQQQHNPKVVDDGKNNSLDGYVT